MKYPVLGQSDAKRIVTSRQEGIEPALEGSVFFRGEGPEEFNMTDVDTLRSSLGKLIQKFPEKLRQRDPSGGRFEGEACVLVHSSLTVSPEMVGDPEFWTWLAVLRMSNIIEWRYGGGKTSLKNYGIGDPKENLFFRLWMRAEMVLYADPNRRYELAIRGDIDLWRSHLIRQNYANCRSLARALVRFQCPDDDPENRRLPIAGIRELAKKLKRTKANLFFEFLVEDEARNIVESIARTIESAALLGTNE